MPFSAHGVGMTGFWFVELKLFGPVQLNRIAVGLLAVRTSVPPAQFGPLFPAVTAGPALMMAVVGSSFQGTDLVGIYAAMGLSWGVGALLGPALAGLAMDFVPHGLPVFVALACLAFALQAAKSRSVA